MIQITRRGTLSGSTCELNELRIQFDRQNYLRIAGFLEADLLTFLQSHLEKGVFYPRVHERIGPNKELCLSGNTALGALTCLTNDEELFRVVQEITGCDRPRGFEGRVYRMFPNRGHFDSWHNDVGDDRLIAMSVNLSTDVYAGGVLELRDRESRQIVDVPNVGPGDAVIFRISRLLEHRVTEVTGDVPKTAFAGWFRRHPDSISFFHQQFELQSSQRSLTD